MQHRCLLYTVFSLLGNVCFCRCEGAGDLGGVACDFGVVSSYVLRDDIELQNNTPVLLLTVFIFGSLATNPLYYSLVVFS